MRTLEGPIGGKPRGTVPSMSRIALVEPADVMPAITELMRQNWDETGFGFEFKPSVETYQAVVDLGLMFVLAAFDGDEIVGYCTMTVTNHMHNPAIKVASNDALFVRPDHRGITAGRLIIAAEREAAKRGATRILWHTRAGTNLADAFTKRGYKPADIVVMKEI